jgi:hypothetical protein
MAMRGSEVLGSRVMRSTAFKRYSSHLIAGFFDLRFTFGGTSPLSMMERTLLSEAKNAVISEWLFGLIRKLEELNGETGGNVPDVPLDTSDEDVAIPLECLAGPVGFRRVAACSTGCVQLQK